MLTARYPAVRFPPRGYAAARDGRRPSLNPHLMLATSLIAVAVALPVRLVASGGMMEWTPGDWAAFAGTVLMVGGAAAAGAYKAATLAKAWIVDLKKQLAELHTRTAVAVGDQVKKEMETVVKQTNGNLSNAIEQVAAEVRTATLADPHALTSFPSTPAELESALNRAAAKAVEAYAAKQLADATPKVVT